MLVSGRWPCLQRLVFGFRENLDTRDVRQLSKALLCKTANPDLTMKFPGVNAMSQLVLGKWPALRCLDTVAISLLTRADWPLENLKLSDNRIDAEAVKILTTAQWPLRHLDLGHNQLHSSALSHLCSGRWPDLQTLVLAKNVLGACVHATAPLCQTDWLHLVSVDLSECLLMKADIAGLCKAHWPNLSLLDLSCNVLDEASMTHLVKSNWPELNSLFLGNNFLNDAAVKVLSHNHWHKLEYLDLQFDIFLTHHAASLLSNEQRRIAVF